MNDGREQNGDLASVGILGGMSPESSLVYYQRLIKISNERLPPGACPRIVIINVNFRPYAKWQHDGRWDLIGEQLSREFRTLAASGCDFAALATNTMHKVLPEIDPGLPILHIVDAIAGACRERRLGTLGLTGTRFTMEDGFYSAALESAEVASVAPCERDRSEIHRIIYQELIHGVVTRGSAHRFADIARRLLAQGAEAILLGCTELAMLTRDPSWPQDIPVIDSAESHVLAIFRRMTAPSRSFERSLK